MFTQKIVATEFLRSCHRGNLLEVKNALEKGEDPSSNQNAALYIASSQGHVDILALLLQDKRVNPADRNNAAIIVALFKCHENVVDCLVKDGQIDCSIPQNVRKFGKCTLKEVESAIANKVDVTSGNNLVVNKALKNKNYDTIKFLLEKECISPCCLDNIIIKTILKLSWSKTKLNMLELLLNPKNISMGVDPAIMDNEAIVFAMQYKCIGLFKQLLKLENIKKGVNINKILEIKNMEVTPFYFAVEHGLIDVVRELLLYKNVEPNIGNPLVLTIKRHSLEMFCLLFNNKKINPAENYNEAIREASSLGYTDIVKLLLSDKRVNPHPKLPDPPYDVGQTEYIEGFDDDDYFERESKWFEDTRTKEYVDFHCNLPLHVAVKKGYTEIVTLLLQDERVDPVAEAPEYIKGWLDSDPRSSIDSFDNLPILTAMENGNLNIFMQLISFKSVKNKLLHNIQLIYYLEKSIEKKYFSIAEYFFRDQEFLKKIQSSLTDGSFASWQVASLLCQCARVGFLPIFETIFQNITIRNKLKAPNLIDIEVWYIAIKFGHLAIAKHLSQYDEILQVGIKKFKEETFSAIQNPNNFESKENHEYLIKNLTQPTFNYLLQFEECEKFFNKVGIDVFKLLMQVGNVPVARLLCKYFSSKKIIVPESFKDDPCYQLVQMPELTYLCAWKISKNTSISLEKLPKELSEPIQTYRTYF